MTFDSTPIMADPHEIMIRVAALEGFRTFVFELGHDPVPILMRAGIDPAQLGNRDFRIPTRCFRLALNEAASATGLPHFGLLLSQRQSFSKLGPVGVLVRHAADLSQAIDRLARYTRTHDGGTLSQLEVDGQSAMWLYGLAGVAGDSAIQQTELTVGLTCNFIRSVFDEGWTPQAVYFEHDRPADVRLFDRVFRCPVLFDRAATGIELSRADLSRPLRTADPQLFGILHDYLDRIDREITEDFIARSKQEIQRLLADGVSLEAVAVALGVNRHALQRRLKAMGTSYQQLLDDVRFEMAQHYMRDTGLSLGEISALLGYSEPAVFTRAFRRRAGQSPRGWRQARLG